MPKFTGSFLDADGALRVFHLDARDFAEAESLVEQIGASGRIDGELLTEGETDAPGPIGLA